MRIMRENIKSKHIAKWLITAWCLSISCFLANHFVVLAAEEVVDVVTVSVPSSCTFSGEVTAVHEATIYNGVYTPDIGTTSMQAFCNDDTGFSIYAVGYSGDEYGATDLIARNNGLLNPSNNIITGTASSGLISNWAMKISPVSGTYAPTIANEFSSYKEVPSVYTKVASFESSTDRTIGSSITSTYAAYISTSQPAGTYTGQVKYTMVHPSTIVEPDEDMLTLEFYGSGLYFDENQTETTNTISVRRICLDAEYPDTCHYALDSGEYKIPLGAPEGGVWFTILDARIEEIPMAAISSASDLINGLVAELGNYDLHLYDRIQFFYKNMSAFYGVFFDGSDFNYPLSFSIVAYAYDITNSTFVNIGGTYSQSPTFYQGTWYVYPYDDQEEQILWTREEIISNIQSESDLISFFNQIVGQVDIPGGSIMVFLPFSISDVDPVYYTMDFSQYDYYGNGPYSVSNMPSSVSCEEYMSCEIPYNIPVSGDSSYGSFLGWYDYDSGSTYAPGNALSLTQDTTLYAIWAGYYTMSFDSVDPAYNMPSDVSCEEDASCEIPYDTPYRDDEIFADETCSYTFDYWWDGGGTYQPGDSYYMGSDNVTLWAQWSSDCVPNEPEPDPDPEPDPGEP